MKLRTLTAVLACGMLLCACSANPDDLNAESIDTEQNAIEEQDTTEQTTDTDAEAEGENIADESTDSGETGDALYESFLNNQAKVLVDTQNDHGEYMSLADANGTECTLDELTKVLTDTYAKQAGVDVTADSVEYGYFDCGSDGVKELAIKINTSMGQEIVAIKEVDGALKLIYAGDEWDRSELVLNYNGSIIKSGNGGWGAFSTEKSVIDADGNWNFVYSAYVTEYIEPGTPRGDLYFNGQTHSLPQDMNLDDSYAFIDFDFNNTLEDGTDDVYSYSKIIENPGNSSGSREYYYGEFNDANTTYDSSNSLYQFLENEGVKPVSVSEADKMIADKEKSVGLTDGSNAKVVTWQILK
ncbi:MAG: hypothetical protein IKO84_10390 [Butyrivibrio sp.]|nr:hypothetical protein [Butyrivibrio sp.]